jgi:hypothetical protein
MSLENKLGVLFSNAFFQIVKTEFGTGLPDFSWWNIPKREKNTK